ncbi:unnamed protein product [Bubo scandiacus]
MAPHAGVPAAEMTSQMTKTPESPGKDHKRPQGMEETKAMQEVSHTPPTPASQQNPARHHRDQSLATRFTPFVAHFGGCQPNSFKFLFYEPRFSNSYSPFYTAQRPTCGYRYHRDIDHTKKVMDIPSANIMKWRPILDTKP